MNAPLTLVHLHAVRDALRTRLTDLDRISTTCGACRFFPSGRCEKFDAVPPQEFQRQPDACQAWEWDGVPF